MANVNVTETIKHFSPQGIEVDPMDLARAYSVRLNFNGDRLVRSTWIVPAQEALVAKKYNPDQPRDPKGAATGGQWTEATAAPAPVKKPYRIRRAPKDINISLSDDQIADEIHRRVPSTVTSIYNMPWTLPGRFQTFGFWTPDGRAIVPEARVEGYHEDWVGGPLVLDNLLDRGFVRFARLYGFKHNELSFSTNRPLTASVRDELRDLLLAHPEIDVNFDIGDHQHGTRRDLERMLGIGEKAASAEDPLDDERREAEDSIASTLHAFFARQWRTLRRQLKAARDALFAARLGRQMLGIVIGLDWGEEEGLLLATLGPVLDGVLSDAARAAWGELTGLGVALSWELYDAAASAWAASYRYGLIRDINASTREQLARTISGWIESDKDFAELTEQVRRIVPPAPKPVLRDRARLIAQTETTRVYAKSRDIGLTEAGLKLFTWQTANDELVCPVCAPLHGQTGEVGKGVRNEETGEYTDQPAHPGCRCWQTASVAELEANVATKHYGPGDHPGTGTPQSVHGEGGAVAQVPHPGWPHIAGTAAEREAFSTFIKDGDYDALADSFKSHEYDGELKVRFFGVDQDGYPIGRIRVEFSEDGELQGGASIFLTKRPDGKVVIDDVVFMDGTTEEMRDMIEYRVNVYSPRLGWSRAGEAPALAGDPYVNGKVTWIKHSFDDDAVDRFTEQWMSTKEPLPELERLLSVPGFKATASLSVFDTDDPPVASIGVIYKNRDETITGTWTLNFERTPDGEIVAKPRMPIFHTTELVGPQAEKDLIAKFGAEHEKFGWITEEEYQRTLAAKIDLYPRYQPAYSPREARLGYRSTSLTEGFYPGERSEIKAAGEKALVADTGWDGGGTFMEAWQHTTDDTGGPQDRLMLEAYTRAAGTLDDYMVTSGMAVALATPTHMDVARYVYSDKLPSLPADPQGVASKAYDSIYERTQNFLREQGIGPDDEIVLYRGMALDPINATVGDEVTLRPRPLSSFTVSVDIARSFAQQQRQEGQVGYVFGVRVPAKAIFAHWSTGVGCASEHELIVEGKYLKNLPMEVIERISHD